MQEHSLTGHHERILGMFAHPDDEVFCAGGLLARSTAAGSEALVVSATRGQVGQIRDPHAATRRSLGVVRARELEEACGRLGVRQAYCLDYLDGALQDVEPDRLASDVARIIHDFAPDAVITFGPDGGYGHPDHVAISAATTRAWSSIASDARRPALFYSHFPQRNLLLSRQFADWLVGQRERFQASPEFAHGLTLLAESASVLGFARDKPLTRWFPAGFSMVEQDERSADLYLILSGAAVVIREEEDGTRRVLRRLGAGEFFGELAVAHGRPRSASVVATEPVTCLVLATETPTAFAGRGAQARLTKAVGLVVGDVEQSADALFDVDVANHLDQKLAAMAAHQTQYPVRPELYPSTLLRAVFGRESFVAVSAPARRATAA